MKVELINDLYKLSFIFFVLFVFFLTGCSTPRESAEAPKIKPTATPIPIAVPAPVYVPPVVVPTVAPTVAPTAIPKFKPTATKASKIMTMPKQSTVTDIRNATVFSITNEYQQFPKSLQKEFKDIVDNEFFAISEKAGISIAVYTDGTLWAYASGKASESLDMTVNTPLMISSTSKTFLSPLILTQIENGHYKLSDSLETVLSGHPDFSSLPTDKINPRVTIEELLTMTSGLSDFNDNIEGKSELMKKSEWSPSDLIKLVQSQYTESGTYEYNDTNVVLLGMIAEFHSGQRLADLYRESFYNTLSITAITLPEEGIKWHPGILKDPGEQFSIPNMAMPYTDISRWASGFGNMIDAAPFGFGYYIGVIGRNRYACCGIISTPENMARWTYELYSSKGSAISKSVRSQLLSSFSDKRIPPWSIRKSSRPGYIPDQYGYLVSKKTIRLPDDYTVMAYGHLGGGSGYSGWMHYSPELDLSIAILTNSQMKLSGTCKVENPGNCITVDVFKKYKEQMSSQ